MTVTRVSVKEFVAKCGGKPVGRGRWAFAFKRDGVFLVHAEGDAWKPSEHGLYSAWWPDPPSGELQLEIAEAVRLALVMADIVKADWVEVLP